jgi:hypothetical protein
MLRFSPPGESESKTRCIKLPKSVAAVFGVYSYCQKLKTQQDEFDG